MQDSSQEIRAEVKSFFIEHEFREEACI